MRDEWIEQLYNTQRSKIINLILRNNGNRGEAEDVFQDTLEVFIFQVQTGKYRGDASISTYLYKIAYFKWLNELKRKSRLQQYQKMAEFAPEALEMPIDSVDMTERCAKMVKSIYLAMSEVCQKLLGLRFYQGKSFKEIASLMDYKNEQVARTKQQKCMDNLREKYRMNPILRECLEQFNRWQ